MSLQWVRTGLSDRGKSPREAVIIVADENIPKVEDQFFHLGSVRLLEGRRIRSDDLKDAAVLLVRSVTQVNSSLLAGTPVQFVGTATIGTDHVDQQYLRDRGITFASAPGSNARSVIEYVIAAVLALMRRSGRLPQGMTMGIIGYGNIGSRLAPRARAMGMHVCANDPPLSEAGGAPAGERFIGLDQMLEEADVVTLHVPLTREEPHATLQLLDESRLDRLRPGATLINTSRGAVLSTEHLLNLLDRRDDLNLVLDVWEGEPQPELRLLMQTALATPHIAGYSYDGKIAGTRMLYEALLRFLGESGKTLEKRPPDSIPLRPSQEYGSVEWADDIAKQMYDVREDDRRMRELLDLSPDARGVAFTRLRRDYPVRREFWNYTLPQAQVPKHLWEIAERALGIRLV